MTVGGWNTPKWWQSYCDPFVVDEHPIVFKIGSTELSVCLGAIDRHLEERLEAVVPVCDLISPSDVVDYLSVEYNVLVGCLRSEILISEMFKLEVDSVYFVT